MSSCLVFDESNTYLTMLSLSAALSHVTQCNGTRNEEEEKKKRKRSLLMALATFCMQATSNSTIEMGEKPFIFTTLTFTFTFMSQPNIEIVGKANN